MIGVYRINSNKASITNTSAILPAGFTIVEKIFSSLSWVMILYAVWVLIQSP